MLVGISFCRKATIFMAILSVFPTFAKLVGFTQSYFYCAELSKHR